MKRIQSRGTLFAAALFCFAQCLCAPAVWAYGGDGGGGGGMNLPGITDSSAGADPDAFESMSSSSDWQNFLDNLHQGGGGGEDGTRTLVQSIEDEAEAAGEDDTSLLTGPLPTQEEFDDLMTEVQALLDSGDEQAAAALMEENQQLVRDHLFGQSVRDALTGGRPQGDVPVLQAADQPDVRQLTPEEQAALQAQRDRLSDAQDKNEYNSAIANVRADHAAEDEVRVVIIKEGMDIMMVVVTGAAVTAGTLSLPASAVVLAVYGLTSATAGSLSQYDVKSQDIADKYPDRATNPEQQQAYDQEIDKARNQIGQDITRNAACQYIGSKIPSGGVLVDYAIGKGTDALIQAGQEHLEENMSQPMPPQDQLRDMMFGDSPPTAPEQSLVMGGSPAGLQSVPASR